MTIETAIKKAGYKDRGKDEMYAITYGRSKNESKFEIEIFLDPSFWQSLGKVLGWKNNADNLLEGMACLGFDGCEYDVPAWQYQWHRFIDHLAAGKDAESYFATLQ